MTDDEVFEPADFGSSMVDGQTYYLKVFAFGAAATDFSARIIDGIEVFGRSMDRPVNGTVTIRYRTNLPARTLCYGKPWQMVDGGTCQVNQCLDAACTQVRQGPGAFSEKEGTALTRRHECTYRIDNEMIHYLVGAYVPGGSTVLAKKSCGAAAPSCYDRVYYPNLEPIVPRP